MLTPPSTLDSFGLDYAHMSVAELTEEYRRMVERIHHQSPGCSVKSLESWLAGWVELSDS